MKNLYIELPPITEVWKEVSVLSHGQSIQERQDNFWVNPRVRRELRMRRALKDVRTLVSFEEVFGPGLLDRYNQALTPRRERRST